MLFYLTFPKYTALRDLDVPLFVNRNALFTHGPKRLPRARGRWALDSGGYTELSTHGRWTITHEQYVGEVRRAHREIGGLDWAACLDWMCEDNVLAKTGKTVEEHQWLTVESYLRLRAGGGADLEHLWVPVLQGHQTADYERHFLMYLASGVDLRRVNVVGVGSVCRRYLDERLRDIFTLLRGLGLRRLHGFGTKETSFEARSKLKRAADPGVEDVWQTALERGRTGELLERYAWRDVAWEEEELSVASFLYTADSAAWSERAKKQALEVWLVRQELARRRGHPDNLVSLSRWGPDELPYCRAEGGMVMFGADVVGPVRPELVGVRASTLPPDDAMLIPSQMLPVCVAEAAAWRPGGGREPHRSCNMCPTWGLEYRARLRAVLEPIGAWQESLYLPALPPPGFEEHRAAIELGFRRQAEHEALRPRVAGLLMRAEAGEDLMMELHQARLELAAFEGRLDLPPEDV